MKEVIEKQTALLQTVEKYLSNDRVIQLSQATIQDQSEKKLDLIYHVLKDGMVDDGNKKALNSNVVKLFNEIKNQTKEIKGLSKLVPVSPEQSKAILDKSRQNREFKSIGQRVQSAKENFKDFFTLRGFLDKTGIAKRGSGGILSEHLDAKEAVQKKAQARIDAGDPTVRLHGVEKSRKIFERQETEAQQLRRNQGDDERKIESYKKLGISEKQIEKSPEAKRLQKTAIELAKVDTALRPEGFDVKTGMIKPDTTENKKAKESKEPKATAKKEAAKKETTAKKETAKKETTALAPLMQLTNSAEKRNNDDVTDIDFKEVVRQPALTYEEPKATAKKETAELIPLMQPTAAKVSEDPLAAQESTDESQRNIEKQTDLLAEIAANTAKMAGEQEKVKPKADKESSDGKGILSGILGFLGDGLMSAVKFLFNPKNILKFISKIALPAMIIGSLVSGIMDGFKAFAETGDIGEALIAGLGGVLSFLSFGLFDAETVRGVVDAVKGFVDDYIIEPVKNFFSFISDSFEKYIVKPLSDFFAPVIDFFKSVKDQLLSMVESIGIPEISFTIPLIDKKVSIGPFYPFKKESAKAESGGASSTIAAGNSDAGAGRGSSSFNETDPRRLDLNTSSTMSAPSPTEGTSVYNKSSENIEMSSKPVQSAPIIVSAPTTNNTMSKQNISMPTPIRNDDSGFNRYLSRNSAIV